MASTDTNFDRTKQRNSSNNLVDDVDSEANETRLDYRRHSGNYFQSINWILRNYTVH